jgi:hypothetical protein
MVASPSIGYFVAIARNAFDSGRDARSILFMKRG